MVRTGQETGGGEHQNGSNTRMSRFGNPNSSNMSPENNQHSQYEIPELDHDWYPILHSHLRKSQKGLGTLNANAGGEMSDGLIGSTTVDAKYAAGGEAPNDTVDYPPMLRTLSTVDEIDARGTFDAREFERELRQMGRQELGKLHAHP